MAFQVASEYFIPVVEIFPYCFAIVSAITYVVLRNTMACGAMAEVGGVWNQASVADVWVAQSCDSSPVLTTALHRRAFFNAATNSAGWNILRCSQSVQPNCMRSRAMAART
jgi:hypothetical protein